jgi:uncharacterized protein (TIGR04255 family)
MEFTSCLIRPALGQSQEGPSSRGQTTPSPQSPVTEALIQFQVRQGRSDFQNGIQELVAKLAPTLYAKGEIRQGTFQFALDGKQSSQPAVSTVSQAVGVRLHSQDEKYVVQVTNQGLTVSRLEPYLEWETFRTEMQRIWELYRSTFRPESITRVAIRYINTILLSVGPETRLERVFTRPPMEPEGMSEVLSSFLNRSVIEDPPSQASVIVTLASQSPVPPSTFPVILDIEAVRQAEFAVSDSSIWDYLEILRDLKNAAFFGSLTEEQVGLYE